MPHNYIPNPDSQFDSWFQKYQFYAVANAVALGLTPAEALEIQTAKIVWSLAFSAHLAAKDAARGAAETKDEKREAAEVTIRLYTGKIQSRRETTDAQREGLGITVPDREPTPLPPEAIQMHPPPLYKVDTDQPGQATTHFGPNPNNERENPMPEIAYAVELWYYLGQPPADVTQYRLAALDTNSPYTQVFATGLPVTVTYRLRYVDRLGRPGPFGPPVTVTISA